MCVQLTTSRLVAFYFSLRIVLSQFLMKPELTTGSVKCVVRCTAHTCWPISCGPLVSNQVYGFPATIRTRTHYNFNLNYILPANYLILLCVSLQMYHSRASIRHNTQLMLHWFFCRFLIFNDSFIQPLFSCLQLFSSINSLLFTLHHAFLFHSAGIYSA